MIIGITGTLAAGKGEVVEFLKQKNFQHFSVREFLTQEINERGLEINRDNMALVANQLREMHSPSYIVEKLYEKAKNENMDCIIESLRAIGEINVLKEQEGFVLLAVDANQGIRYVRSQSRKSETDKVSFEKFKKDEEKEMFSMDPNKQNLSECIKLADFKIENNGTLEELKYKLGEIFSKISEEKYIRPPWDEYFMKITAVVAERATCLRHNIGAIIIKNKRIIATGYNGAARGAEDCLKLGCKKDELNLASGMCSEDCRAIHAEQNAIIQAALHGVSTEGATLYCTTIPCRMCAKEIVNAGIKKVITYSNYEGARGSIEYLKNLGVEFETIQRPNSVIRFKD